MQSTYAETGDSEEFFSRIPFDNVYHEGSIGGDHSIITARCAEVLAPSPLALADHLQWIYCRSHAERQTLLHMLDQDGPEWATKIRVSDDIQVFQKDFLYVENVSIQDDGIYFKLHQRPHPWEIDISLRVWNNVGELVINFEGAGWLAMPNPPTARWTIKTVLNPGFYLAEIRLEGCLAYRNRLLLDPKPF